MIRKGLRKQVPLTKKENMKEKEKEKRGGKDVLNMHMQHRTRHL